jgi:hypothetical protein
MAQEVELTIDGTKYDKVHTVSYELFTPHDDSDGKPSNVPRGLKLKITRESDDNIGIAKWAFDSSQVNRKSGSVLFRDPNLKKDLKELSWENGFITHYEEHVPSTEQAAGEQMYEYFEISAELVQINGEARYEKDWKGK